MDQFHLQSIFLEEPFLVGNPTAAQITRKEVQLNRAFICARAANGNTIVTRKSAVTIATRRNSIYQTYIILCAYSRCQMELHTTQVLLWSRPKTGPWLMSRWNLKGRVGSHANRLLQSDSWHRLSAEDIVKNE